MRVKPEGDLQISTSEIPEFRLFNYYYYFKITARIKGGKIEIFIMMINN
jgi:hypothetical protein